MSLFTKQLCSIYQQEEEKEVTTETTVTEMGYMYKRMLHLVKVGTNSWVLSHELTGYSIVTLAMPLPEAKKAAILIYNLIDWDSMDKDVINDRMRSHLETIATLKDISFADPDTLETIRLKMLGAAKTIENVISLSFGDV